MDFNIHFLQISFYLSSLIHLNLGQGAFNAFGMFGQPILASMDLLKNPSSNVILTMMDHAPSPLAAAFNPGNLKSREDHISAFANQMQQISSISQAPILSMLNTFGVQAESYWITNQIYVKQATPTIIQSLMNFPGIKSIAREMEFPLFPFFDLAIGPQPNGTQWNVKILEADKIWKETKGKGIIVAGIDTGVRATHSALKDNYVGTQNNGWYDPILYTSEPTDIQGHGTHTLGTMAGKKGIGVAPEAKWMACRGCFMQSCLQHALIACGQFMLCPNDPRGEMKEEERNCTGTPHVINNSWGTSGGQSWFDPIIKAWAKAGIMSFFAMGNSGPKCETGGSPGDHDDVVTVGATDKQDKLASFSSRGPKVKYVALTNITGDENTKGKDHDGETGEGFLHTLLTLGKKKIKMNEVKPNVCAPGHQINSAYFLTDNSYKLLSGTSMASPAVAGVAALLLSKDPTLTYEEMKQLLYSTTERKLPPNGQPQCGPEPEDEFPNSMYGYGRVNAWKAFKKLKKMKESKNGSKKKAKKEKKKGKESEDSEEKVELDEKDQKKIRKNVKKKANEEPIMFRPSSSESRSSSGSRSDSLNPEK